MRPLRGCSDWGGDGAIVTFIPMDRHLMDMFELDCVWFETEDGKTSEDFDTDEWFEKDTIRKVDVTKFDKSKLKNPGAYRDEQGEECYTVILPFAFSVEKLLLEWIEKLNDKFDKDFELYTDCLNCGDEVKIGDNYSKHDMVFCSEECASSYED